MDRYCWSGRLDGGVSDEREVIQRSGRHGCGVEMGQDETVIGAHASF